MNGATMYRRINEEIQGGLAVIGHNNVNISHCHIDNLIVRDCSNVAIIGCIIDNLSVENCTNCTISGNITRTLNISGGGSITIFGDTENSLVFAENVETENIQTIDRYNGLDLDHIIERYEENNPDEIDIHGGLHTGSWHFYGNPQKYKENRGVYCSNCNTLVYSTYVYIIKKLKKAGLLSKSYPYLCCTCYKKRVSENVQ